MLKNKCFTPGALLSAALFFAAFPALVWAAERGTEGRANPVVTLEGTRIRGDQELPTVLYLVPWQPPAVQSLPSSGGGFMAQQTIEPLERAQFQRLLSYHQRFKALHPEPEQTGQESEP